MPRLRASHAPIWSKCPASIDLPTLEPTDRSGAIEGDAVHLMAFRRARGDTDESGIKIPVTEEMREAAQGFVDYCNDLNCDQKAREVTFGGASMPPEVGGTADFIGYASEAGVIHIVDLKYGFSSVKALDNAQLLIYSLGAFIYFKLKRLTKIHLHIYQPRDYINGPIKVWNLMGVAWEEITKDLTARAKAALTYKHAITGDHCRYCKSRVYCPAFLKSASSALETVETDPDTINLSADALAAEYEYLLRAEALVKSARKGFEDLITQNIESGSAVPGWVVGSTGGKRRWKADIETIRSAEGLLGIKLIEEKPISISAARKNPDTRAFIDSLMSKSNGSKKLQPFNETEIKETFK